MRILTIGFTRKSAEKFFATLKHAKVSRVIDVRLNNVSQLAGFAKKKDLEYFLKSLCQMEYVHEPELAPTKDILDAYKKQRSISWEDYEQQFGQLLEERRIEQQLEPEMFEDACLLCSEDKPHHCHRRLVAEYLQQHWGDIEIDHLG